LARLAAAVEGQKIWLVGIAASALLHTATFTYISSRPKIQVREPETVKVRIVETPPAAPVVVPPKPKAETPKPKPVKKIATERRPPAVPVPDAKPIQGLDKSAVSPDGKGIAAPIGNTLMTEDTGVRVKDAAPMAADLSADARLIRESITTPQYTDAALDANFEGVVMVDVYVDETGAVREAEMRKKVGFGMDERILAAARKARFEPRKNKLGGPESAWTEIRFTMQIP
jgi:TonB family protein